jgi:hypothetical protein
LTLIGNSTCYLKVKDIEKKDKKDPPRVKLTKEEA